MKDTLKKLCQATGVAGLETEAAELAKSLLMPYMDTVTIDAFGNVMGLRGSRNPEAKTLLLDAHIDEIGMIVTSIDDRGFIKFSSCGGLDRRILAAQVVTIHGKQPVTGVIGTKPPHLEEKDEADKLSSIDALYIDAGLSKEEAQRQISPGDRITIPSDFVELLNGRVSCKAIDDRAGVACILRALERLDGQDLKVNLAVQFSSREETGGQGAQIAAYARDPDLAVALDVSFALTPDAKPHQCGKMGEGVMIGYHPVLDKRMSDQLAELAKSNKIAYQLEVMGGRNTSTNADPIILTKAGVPTALLSIPLKYMHTPIEQVSLFDLEETARLLAAYCQCTIDS